MTAQTTAKSDDPGRRVRPLAFLIVVALNVGGFAFGDPHGPDGTRLPKLVGLASILILVGLVNWARLRRRAAAQTRDPLLDGVARGILFAFAGDLAIAGIFFPGQLTIMLAILLFGTGYTLYALGLRRTLAAKAPSFDAIDGLFVATQVGVSVGAWAWLALYRQAGAIAVATAIYTLILTTLPAITWAMVRREPRRYLVLAAGGLCLWASDIVLAARFFNRELFAATVPAVIRGDLAWLFYAAGELIFVWAATRGD